MQLIKSSMQEVWKDIPSYEGIYQVSNLGNVRSLNFRRERKIKRLNTTTTKNGYRKVSFNQSQFEGKKTYLVHRLVLCSFQNKPLDYPFQVNHIDGVKNNNILENLEFVTPSGNAIHALNTGLKTPQKGSQVKTSLLTESDVIEIKKLLKEGDIMQKDIATMFNVSKVTICSIHNETRWKHITI